MAADAGRGGRPRELVYPPVIGAALTAFRFLDLRLTVEGSEHVPRTGGAVLASTHLSYLDFLFVGLAARPARRLVRFMAKSEVFTHPVSGPLMRGMHHIPVDRSAGVGAYAAAVTALREGEIVGVFPEATISESFTVRNLKTGAARMAAEAAVPLVPMTVWGPHRLWTKGRPRRILQRHVPVTILVGEPLPQLAPDRAADPAAVTADLRNRLSTLLERAQDGYPDRA